jgi:hypothetical protein
MIGPFALSCSRAYMAGMQRGYRLCSRSLVRRFFLALFVWVLLLGSGLGFVWGSADLFSRLATGEEITKTVVSKWQAWHLVHPKR